MKLKYSDLTRNQKRFICNSCGNKGGYIKPPNFIFKASCNHHDFYYWRGCTKEDFKEANREFYNLMKKDIEEVEFYKKAYYHVWAFSYFKAVEFVGKKYFNFSDKQKTLEDLKKEIALSVN